MWMLRMEGLTSRGYIICCCKIVYQVWLDDSKAILFFRCSVLIVKSLIILMLCVLREYLFVIFEPTSANFFSLKGIFDGTVRLIIMATIGEFALTYERSQFLEAI